MPRPYSIESIASFVLGLERLGSRTLFVDRERFRTRSLSYAETARRARGVAALLARRGVEPGDRVAILGPAAGAWAVRCYGAWLAGATVVPLESGSSPALQERIRKLTGAKLVLDGSQDRELEEPTGQPRSFPGLAARPDDLLEVVYTSGTTGAPKGVCVSHANLLANLQPLAAEMTRYARWLRLAEPLVFLHIIPLSHLFGQVLALFLPPLLRGQVVFEGPSPARIARAAREQRANLLVCVPQQLASLASYLCQREGVDAASLRAARPLRVPLRLWRYRRAHRALGFRMWAAIVGGAALPEPVETLWRKLGFGVIAGYGLTETAPVVTVSHPLAARAGRVGKALPGVELRIAEDGEVLVRGPNVSAGYFEDRASAPRRAPDAWLPTGDLGRLDPDGQLVILGRKKDVIVGSDGLNVYPDDVERALEEDERVAECAVVERATASGPRVHAVLVLRPEAAATPGADAAIVADANARLEPHQQIRSCSRYSAPLPRSSLGKLKRAAIRAALADPDGAAPEDPALSSTVAAALGRLLGQRPLEPGSRLAEDLGLSSLDRVELLLELESRASRSLDETAFGEARSVADLERLIEQGPQEISARPRRRAVFPGWPHVWALRGFRRLLVPLALGPIQRLFLRVEAHGLDRLAALEPPFLLVANHQSALDPGPLLRALPARLRPRVLPLMGTDAFRRWLEPREAPLASQLLEGLGLGFARLCFGALLLPSGPELKHALEEAARHVDRGYSLLVFPEGMRSPDGRIQKFRPGVGVIASELGLPVLPARIDGMSALHPRGAYLPRRGVVSVRFGRVLPVAAQRGGPERLTEAIEACYHGSGELASPKAPEPGR